MFEEIPSSAPPPSQRTAVATFAVAFGIFLAGLTILWFRWPGPRPFIAKIRAGEFAVCAVFSAIFLLDSKRTSAETNRKRIMFLFFAECAVQILELFIQ